MYVLAVTILAQIAPPTGQTFREMLRQISWENWLAEFWPYIFADRFMVILFLPLVPILLLLPRRHLRIGIIVTSLIFIGYLFGPVYPLVWLAMCVAFYRLSESFAVEAKRKDVLQWGPPLAAILCVGGWYIGSMALGLINITRDFNSELFDRARWLFPLNVRDGSWQFFLSHPPQIFAAVFFVPQLNGIVIFTIRMMHYFSELKRDTIPRAERTLLNFIAFASFGPTLMQGPIERFHDFQEGLAHCHERRTRADVGAGLARIGLGLMKNVFCVAVLLPLLLKIVVDGRYYEAPERIQSYAVLFFCAHLQVLWIYLHFSGYCDIAIGLARLVGYRAVENFDQPWLATSLTDMWRRWHISFSFILRDYVFMPLVRQRWNTTLSLVVTFVVCALLHNLNLGYLLWGVLMGLMVAVNQKWSRWMRQLDRHPTRRLAAVRHAWLRLAPLPTICAWALTINAFVLSGLAAFGGQGGFRVAWELIRRPALGLADACGWR
jgi:D-alanyl-lipoteichoic acid acyltransferase DltB (MBOAT superfamily)